jgi:dihydroflavonol-4-reductase
VQRLVHFSSIHALDPEPLDEPMDETRPLVEQAHHSPYSRSKAAGERVVRAGAQKGLDAVILYPSAIVGPYDYKPSYFGQAVLGLARGRIPGLVEGGFDWVDVRDVVEGAIQSGLHAPSGSSYLLSGHWHSVQEVARMVQAVTGRHAPRLVVPTWVAYQAAPLMRWVARFYGSDPIYTRVTLAALHSNRLVSSARAARDLGYQSRSLQQTLADTITWFEGNGYLDSHIH